MKAFLAPHAWLPSKWLWVAGAPPHVYTAELVVIARLKGDAFAMLTGRGVSETDAKGLLYELGVQPRPYFEPLGRLVQAGVIDPEVPAVYVWCGGRDGDVIIRIEPTGEPTFIAHMESTRDGVIAVPAT